MNHSGFSSVIVKIVFWDTVGHINELIIGHKSSADPPTEENAHAAVQQSLQNALPDLPFFQSASVRNG